MSTIRAISEVTENRDNRSIDNIRLSEKVDLALFFYA